MFLWSLFDFSLFLIDIFTCFDTFISGSRKFTDWGINAISLPLNFSFSFEFNFFPLYIISPSVVALSGSIPSIAWANKLFPEPLEPTTANISPSYKSTSKFVITCKSLLLNPFVYWEKETPNSFTDNIGSFFINTSYL